MVDVGVRALDCPAVPPIDTGRASEYGDIDVARASLAGRTVWHVNSTEHGGGVAELLHGMVNLHVSAGIQARRLVSVAPPPFFHLTKRLHHRLHGSTSSKYGLAAEDQRLYRDITAEQARRSLDWVAQDDLVVLHDYQTLGMAPRLRSAGVRVAWRYHVGTARQTEGVAEAWAFLAPYLDAPDQLVFSSEGFIPPSVDRRRARIMYPSIDPRSAKSRAMAPFEMHTLLAAAGLEGGGGRDARTTGTTADGSLGRVVHDGPLPPEAAAVVQVARWDVLKDMAGVLQAFRDHIAPRSDAHLVLAGPDPAEVSDDLENAQVLEQLLAAHAELAPALRRRTHLVILSLTPREANALLVNALQRRATVLCQKSLEEGFGLTVTEAMFKRGALVTTGVGGIREQVRHGEHALVIDDPHDLETFGDAVVRLLGDAELRETLGKRARERCQALFVVDRELHDYARLYTDMLA